MNRLLLILLFLFTTPLLAQEEEGEGLPPLDIENVTIVGTRVIRLPAARKGEVVDSSKYILPPGDSLLFGERVSNFGGPGGALPEYRELDPPARANLEASVGTYLSPTLRLHGEYVQQPFDAMGTLEYSSTAGYADSAAATSLLALLRAGLVIGGGDPSAPRVRVGAGVNFTSDSYTLFGTRTRPYDRARSALAAEVMVSSAQDGLVDYALHLDLEQTTVEDQIADSSHEAGASTPGFGLALAAGDDTLRGRLFVDYQTTTLRYEGSKPTPNFVVAGALVEWNPGTQISIEAGLSYYGGQHSDSGSASLIAPRATLRYTATPVLTLFAAFAPEMRAPSYRGRLMAAPYVEREVVLRPERVPVSLSGGARLTLGDGANGSTAFEARVVYESAENTPVVAADLNSPGQLRWDRVDSRTFAIVLAASTAISTKFSLGAEAEIRSAIDDETDEPLPMVSPLTVSATGRYQLNSALEFDARASFVGERRTALGADAAAVQRSIASRLLLDVGATYHIADRFDLFALVTNLLTQKYQWWEGYEAPGLELRGGARLRF